MLGEIIVSRAVALTIGMLPTVNFDNEPALETHKIDDIRTERNLTSELHADRSRTQGPPQFSFSIRHRNP